jgi:hypothetical protein
MKLTTLTAAFAVTLLFSQSAQARAYHQHWQHRHVAHHNAGSRFHAAQSEYGYGSRPSAWCGWEMRHLVGRDPGAAFNLARNWAHWGHPGPAGVGAVVVWSHHVGKIVGQAGGMWVIESGNDGHTTRARPRPIGGAIAIRWA